MKTLKKILTISIITGYMIPIPSSAQEMPGVYNAAVSNPFVFCSSPRPPRKSPMRPIWDEICPAGDPNNFPEMMNEPARLGPDIQNQVNQQIQDAQNGGAMYDPLRQKIEETTPISPMQQLQNLNNQGY